MKISQINLERIAQAKAAYVTHLVDLDAIATLITGDIKPEVGDLVLARVDKTGQHERLQLTNGRKADLFPGDEIIVCYGNRYAPDQFEAEMPQDLSACHLAAGGGIAAQVLVQHAKMKSPTAITPIGILGDSDGQRLNLSQWTLPPTSYIGQRPLTLAVVGASMNAGKSTTAAYLIRGLAEAGLNVGAAKITGTGAGGDIWLMRDAGASLVLDFTYVGFPSTYKVAPQEVQRIFTTLTNHLAGEGVDAIVLEIADGLYQKETSELVSSVTFRNTVDGIVYAAQTALGAFGGVEWLRRHNLPILAVSGLVTCSPLAIREAERAIGLPVLNLEMLHKKAPQFAEPLFKNGMSTTSAKNLNTSNSKMAVLV
jgi:hypothetical protein